MRLLPLWLCPAILWAQGSFAVLGDRTGGAQPGVYEQVWKQAAALRPAFVLSAGDTIEGLRDETAERQWRAVQAIWMPHGRLPLYLTPGNHDIWSDASAALYRHFAGRAAPYSFDHGPLHVTVLDNSRSDELSPEQLRFLAADLARHATAREKLIVSHRPSWLLPVLLQNESHPLHQLARRYGVRWVLAGHVHQMIHMEFQGVHYVSMASSGGHLRGSRRYQDGWFFGFAEVRISDAGLDWRIHELGPPHGEGRVTPLAQWGKSGLSAHVEFLGPERQKQQQPEARVPHVGHRKLP